MQCKIHLDNCKMRRFFCFCFLLVILLCSLLLTLENLCSRNSLLAINQFAWFSFVKHMELTCLHNKDEHSLLVEEEAGSGSKMSSNCNDGSRTIALVHSLHLHLLEQSHRGRDEEVVVCHRRAQLHALCILLHNRRPESAECNEISKIWRC